MTKKITTFDTYIEIKEQYKNSIVLFHAGEFLRGYFNDALIISKELNYKLMVLSLGNKQYCTASGFPLNVENSVVRVLVNRGYKVVVCKNKINPDTLVKEQRVAGEYDNQDYKDLTKSWTEHFDKYYGMSEDDLCKEFQVHKMKKSESKRKLKDTVSGQIPLEVSESQSGREVIGSNIVNNETDLKEQLWNELSKIKKETLSMENSLYTLIEWKNKFSY